MLPENFPKIPALPVFIHDSPPLSLIHVAVSTTSPIELKKKKTAAE
jgi:hypothetical protein